MSRPIHESETIRGCGFHHIAVVATDWEASLRFYTEGLGFSPRANWGEAPRRATLLDTGDGNYLELFERDADWAAGTGEANILHLCLRADSCDDAVERARVAGAEVTVEPKVPVPFTQLGVKTRIAFVKGPAGEMIEFFESNDL